MRNYWKILLALACFGDVSYANTIPNGMSVVNVARPVEIFQIVSARIANEKFQDFGGGHSEVSGQLQLTLNVEGNICSDLPEHVQVDLRREGLASGRRVLLSVFPTPTTYGCPAIAQRRNVLVPLYVSTFLGYPEMPPTPTVFVVNVRDEHLQKNIDYTVTVSSAEQHLQVNVRK